MSTSKFSQQDNSVRSASSHVSSTIGDKRAQPCCQTNTENLVTAQWRLFNIQTTTTTTALNRKWKNQKVLPLVWLRGPGKVVFSNLFSDNILSGSCEKKVETRGCFYADTGGCVTVRGSCVRVKVALCVNRLENGLIRRGRMGEGVGCNLMLTVCRTSHAHTHMRKHTQKALSLFSIVLPHNTWCIIDVARYANTTWKVAWIFTDPLHPVTVLSCRHHHPAPGVPQWKTTGVDRQHLCRPFDSWYVCLTVYTPTLQPNHKGLMFCPFSDLYLTFPDLAPLIIQKDSHKKCMKLKLSVLLYLVGLRGLNKHLAGGVIMLYVPFVTSQTDDLQIYMF